MNIENNIFKRSKVIFDKLIDYGFIKDNDLYIYEKEFMNGSFKAIICIDKNGLLNGKVIDIEMCEEYNNIRTDMNGEYVGMVRDNYKSILNDIKCNCFETRYFISNQANRITKLIKDKYSNDPEFLWEKSEGCGVFRNQKSKKWYGIIMNIDLSKIDDGSGEVEVMNVKLDRNEILSLVNKDGLYPAYHMNKKDWISILLNDTLSDEEIMDLISKSYNLVN